ncbi:DUF6338 family protein [Nocardia tengchongensis]|uniref:DUF6338 family protein n=1 Tax=Nocardia tengchongensis TaxID=2055889 RepID=UPI0036C47E98
MSLPQTVFQFFALLLLVVPGIVFAAMRRRLRGPGRDDKDFSARLATAIAVSIAFASLYALCFGPWLITLWNKNTHGVPGYLQRPQLSALTVATMAFAVPALVAACCQIRVRWTWRFWKAWPSFSWEPAHHPAPSAWDAHAGGLADCFIRIRVADGTWVGGYMPSDRGFISTYPEPRDIFIPEPWQMGPEGEFLDPVVGGLGMYVPLNGTERVQWTREPAESAPRPQAPRLSPPRRIRPRRSRPL